MLIEEWEDDEMLDAYLQSKEFGVVLSIVDLSNEKPVIRFDKLLSTDGLEYLQGVKETRNHE